MRRREGEGETGKGRRTMREMGHRRWREKIPAGWRSLIEDPIALGRCVRSHRRDAVAVNGFVVRFVVVNRIGTLASIRIPGALVIARSDG